MRHDGADQDERRHADRNGALGVVYLIQDEIVARFHRRTQVAVHQPDEQARNRQQSNQPTVRLARLRRPVQRHQQGGRRGTAKHAREDGNGDPAQQVTQH